MNSIGQINLGDGFKRYFEVLAATTDSLCDDVYRIRHEVYCEELGYEAPRDDHREVDEYDSHSYHCLLRSSSEGHDPVGCVRMVVANPDDPDELLPMERLCNGTIDRSIVDPSRLPRNRIGEISRLAVRSKYRRRKGENNAPLALSDNDFGTQDQPRFPYIPIGLYLAATAIARKNGVETVFVLTEPRLASHFAKLGFAITRIGNPIDHRGTRVPSMFNVNQTIDSMRDLLKPIWSIVEEAIERGDHQHS